jgi:hypothetical protein
MPRGFLLLLCCTLAPGQFEPRDPFDRAMQSSQQARTQGNPGEAAARREEARKLLEQMPAGLPQWAGRVQNLAQAYQGSGRHVQARAVVQDALMRANALPEWNPAHIQLLNTLAEFWQQDGNLLKALSYREKAVAAFEATPPGASSDAAQAMPPGVPSMVASTGRLPGVINGRFTSAFRGANNSYLYDQLANLYRQLGRPEATAKVMTKMRSLIQNDPGALAHSYEQDGDLDAALAVYQKQAADTAAKPQAQIWDTVAPLQSIASLYERENRLADAAAMLDQAAARLDASGEPSARNQAAGLRLRVASLLQRSGQRQAADQAYQALLNEPADRSQDLRSQVVQQYANYLSETDRGSQGSQMLKDYLANHTDLQPWQEANILFGLSQIARKAGQKDLAEDYQRAATEKQRAQQAQPVQLGLLIGPELQKAQTAINQGNVDEAVSLALDAIASASSAPDGEQVAWQVPNLAAQLANRKAPEKAEQIYWALFPLLEARAVDNVGAPAQALQQYARFLMGQKDRWGDAALAIDRYRDNVVAAQGADTAGMMQVQQLRIELAQIKGAHEEAEQKAEELLALEESLSGATSSSYLRAAQTAANVYQSSGKMDRALALHGQIVAIADRTLSARDAQRGFLRMNAAMAFATARQFDQAERLANEAIAVGEALYPPRPDLFRSQAAQIEKMKANAQSGGVTAQPGTSVFFTPSGQRVVRDRVYTTPEIKTAADGPRP